MPGSSPEGNRPDRVQADPPPARCAAARSSAPPGALQVRYIAERATQRGGPRRREAAARIGVVQRGEQPPPGDEVVLARGRADPGPQRLGVVGGDDGLAQPAVELVARALDARCVGVRQQRAGVGRGGIGAPRCDPAARGRAARRCRPSQVKLVGRRARSRRAAARAGATSRRGCSPDGRRRRRARRTARRRWPRPRCSSRSVSSSTWRGRRCSGAPSRLTAAARRRGRGARGAAAPGASARAAAAARRRGRRRRPARRSPRRRTAGTSAPPPTGIARDVGQRPVLLRVEQDAAAAGDERGAGGRRPEQAAVARAQPVVALVQPAAQQLLDGARGRDDDRRGCAGGRR